MAAVFRQKPNLPLVRPSAIVGLKPGFNRPRESLGLEEAVRVLIHDLIKRGRGAVEVGHFEVRLTAIVMRVVA